MQGSMHVNGEKQALLLLFNMFQVAADDWVQGAGWQLAEAP